MLISYSLYELVNPIDNLPFYIGLTDNPTRRIGEHCYITKKDWIENPFKTKIIYNLKKQSLEPIMNVLFDNLTEKEVVDLEIHMIEVMRILQYPLTNISPGGNICSNLTRIKISKANKGKRRSISFRLKISKLKKGKPLSAKHKLSIGIGGLGRKLSIKTKQAIGNGNRGKIRSFQLRQQISKTLIGRKATNEAKTNMKKAQINRGIILRNKINNFLTEKLLNEHYVEKNKSIEQLSKEFKINENYISLKIKEFKLVKNKYPFLTKEFLFEEFITKSKSQRKIAKECCCDRLVIKNYLIKFNII